MSLKILEEATLVKKNLSTSWSKDDNGVLKLHIPDGFKYCKECAAFTPHLFESPQYGDGILTCNICDDAHYIYDSCDNCGYYFGEGDEHFPPEYSFKMVKHHEGCHFKEDTSITDHFYYEWLGHRSIYFMLDTHANRVLKSFLEGLTLKDQWRFNYELAELENQQCGCPEIEVIPVDNCVGFIEHNVYSLDCSNAMEWEYELRCPICGDLKYFADSNC